MEIEAGSVVKSRWQIGRKKQNLYAVFRVKFVASIRQVLF